MTVWWWWWWCDGVVCRMSAVGGRRVGGGHVDERGSRAHGPRARLLSVGDGRRRLALEVRARHVLGPRAAPAEPHRARRLRRRRPHVGGVLGGAGHGHGRCAAARLPTAHRRRRRAPATRRRTHRRRQVRART